MSEAGRLARGKANFEAGKFLNNPETIDYVKTIKPAEVIIEEDTKKEKKKNGR